MFTATIPLLAALLAAPPPAAIGQLPPAGHGQPQAAGQTPSAAAPAAPTAQSSSPMPPLTLQQAITMAKANSQQFRTAQTAAQLAGEDRVQARAALLPTLSGVFQYIYTQPNGTLSGVFVPNDGPQVYYTYGTVHGDLFAPTKWADYRLAAAAEAVARAKADVAARGLVATIVQDYYGVVTALRKASAAGQAVTEATQFLDITKRQARGGEVAQSDVIKAQIQVDQRRRDAQDAELAALKARLALSVLVFPDYREEFAVVDDIEQPAPLPSLDGVMTQANAANPDLRAAHASVAQETAGETSARSAYLPSISFDYFYGIQANQFATHSPPTPEFPYGVNLLGSSAQVQVAVPLWNWGATQSRLRQAELRVRQARADLTLTERMLRADLVSYYREAQVAQEQVATLRTSLDLSNQSLRLTLLRYQAGEATALEVVDAQTTLILARTAYDDGLVRYRVALAALQTLTGTL